MFYKKYTRTLNPIKQQFFYYFFKDTKNISKNSWVADIASYNGMNADIFKYHNYVAVDKDLEILKKIINQKYIVRADILHLPFLLGSFDAVVSTNTLCNLKFSERPQALEELGRLVKSGGYFIFTIPLWDSGGEKVRFEEIFKQISNIMKDSFEIKRIVVYGGLFSQFYNSVITKWFKKREKRSLFLSRLYMFLTLMVSSFELFFGFSKFSSISAYLCLRKKNDQTASGHSFDDFFSRLACPVDKSDLIKLASGKFKCKFCEREFVEQEGIINLLI